MVAKPGVPMRLMTHDGKLLVVRSQGDKPVRVRVRTNAAGRLHVAAIDGTVKLDAEDGKAKTLAAGSLVQVSGRGIGRVKVLPRYPELISPGVDAQLSSTRVALRWQRPSGKGNRFRLQVSRHLSFDVRLVDENVAASSIQLTLPSARYAWRVATIDASGIEGEFGFARRFTVKASKPQKRVVQLAPLRGAVFEVAKPPYVVTFRWTEKRPNLRLVVGRGKKIGKQAVAIPAQKDVAKVPLPLGRYSWALFIGKNRVTPIRPFTIKRKKPPKLTLPDVDWR
jgi:hypothetical protein